MFDYDGTVETEFWTLHPKQISPDNYERIMDAVYECDIIDFLAEKMEWGPGAVSEGMISMDDYDPESDRAKISIDIPYEIYDEHEEKVLELLEVIDGALDDYAGGWVRNC